ncbi:restriction endonuclease [Aquimarina sp. BL5]|uniref:McrB family protein n=1 Tax=Aquimarina sp. BL5 TaxID=1714860 RepID=UPI000E538CE4|nr:AAA family ATPase [Aquimarina sp. BL5]AXT49490.1 restriction endonuclease [Aquimarina sp. BL5]RKN04386.1 restriction endonuclease [Aquimarina sp. BL5]
MDFFTKGEFELLNQYKGKTCDRTIPEFAEAYAILVGAYKKVEEWANLIKGSSFKDGVVKIWKKPTSQASKFDGYLWAKIYPTKTDFDDKWLAITVGLDDDFHYDIKIDTVGLKDDPVLRKGYEKYRGDFYNSDIVIRYRFDEIADWDELITKSNDVIGRLIELYPKVKALKIKRSEILSLSEIIKNETMYKEKTLNQILYGPPGTGKTYKTKELAVNIINPGFKIDNSLSLTEQRVKINQEYESLFQAGQIVFTTFHQSMSYEDFVEGIKPETNDGKISYDIIPGIFKELCEIADTKSNSNFDEVLINFKKDLGDKEKITVDTGSIIFDVFYTGGKTFKINPKESKNENPMYPASIQNLLKLYKNVPDEGMYNPSYVKGILNYLLKNYKLTPYEEVKGGIDKNYVLIIDEINRGNVSQIFGELITLLESDKRIGNKEEIRIKLPYSKTPFGVPKNLFIIGTMNTADRSVEALDTALRRRFSFIEMMPNPAVIGPSKVEDIDLIKVLETINNRIEVLIDRDHTIGHSYFMDINSLDDLVLVFKDKVIPLLQEYFYGDYGKIGLVLGEGFVDVETDKKTAFAKFTYPDSRDFNTVKYKLKEINKKNIEEAIHLLLNITNDSNKEK